MSDIKIIKYLDEMSSDLNYNGDPVAIILAAGHGKRIKSDHSKMLHKIWGEPTAIRVARVSSNGLNTKNQIIVVGIKAGDVAHQIGKVANRLFVLQENQNGTGDAARVALDKIDESKNIGDIYILPGDMGIMTSDIMSQFRTAFEKSNCGMMILTGIYSGNPSKNYYGRIVRVPKNDINGNFIAENHGKVFEIKEHKDILAMEENEKYFFDYNNSRYCYTKQELLNIPEYNSGVYAAKFQLISKYIHTIGTDNVQGEIYITDLIKIFNNNNITVQGFATENNNAVMGFNTKSVLNEMNNIYRNYVYNSLCDIVTIEDKNDFFLADEVVTDIIEMSKTYNILNIEIGKGAYIEKNVKLARNIKIGRNTKIYSNVTIESGVIIEDNVILDPGEAIIFIDKDSHLKNGNILKGDIKVGAGTKSDYGVIIEGNIQHPVRIGENVVLKGSTNIFGSIIENDCIIQQSVLNKNIIHRVLDPKGNIKPLVAFSSNTINRDIVEKKEIIR